jgi:predicted ArsR family transcriptional regulator
MIDTDELTFEERVLRRIKEYGPVSPQDVADGLGITWHAARNILDRLMQAGQVRPWVVDFHITLYG